MSTCHLYLSVIPESLVASMLPPKEFGAYLATGTRKRPHGQAMYFRLKDGFQSDYFDIGGLGDRCVPHPDGQPKHSVYLAIYRVLEHVPLDALEALYLATAHGQVLGIQPAELPSPGAQKYHLYQELAPVHPLIASSLPPREFCRYITEPGRPINVPKVCFAELDLDDLGDDPVGGSGSKLPYPHLGHIRSCLAELQPAGTKQTKTVDRLGGRGLIYRCIKTGLFVGDHERVLYYPYPSRQEMETRYYTWWRCANDAELQHSIMSI